MECFDPKLWWIVRDATALFLCCVVILYLFKNHIHCKKNASKKTGGDHSERFDDQVVFQLLKQQTMGSLDMISGAINKERLALQGLMDNGEIEYEQAVFSTDKESENGKELLEKDERPQAGNLLPAGCHCNIENLVDSGMDLPAISKKVDMPRGEIELILKLGKMSSNGRALN